MSDDLTVVPTAELARYLNRLAQASDTMARAAAEVMKDARVVRECLTSGFRPSENGQSLTDMMVAVGKFNLLLEMAPSGTTEAHWKMAMDVAARPYFTAAVVA